MIDERRRVVVRIAEELRLGLAHLHALLDRDRGKVGEPAPRLGALALLAQHRADAQLREPAALAVGDGLVALRWPRRAGRAPPRPARGRTRPARRRRNPRA